MKEFTNIYNNWIYSSYFVAVLSIIEVSWLRQQLRPAQARASFLLYLPSP